MQSVLALLEQATRVDAVAPLSEQVLLQVRDSPADAGELPVAGSSRHLLAYDGPRLAGYAHLTPALPRVPGAPTEPATAELVVAVASRRRGVARLLLGTLQQGALDHSAVEQGALDEGTATLQAWAHGDLPAARSLAMREGFTVVRQLWQLRRPLGDGTARLPDAELPEGFRSRGFVVGRDEGAWLTVNARAFAHHPEQGRITRHDLELRQREPWFDPAGFLLVEDVRTDPPTLAAFHWTKVHQPAPSETEQGDGAAPGEAVGEVYVLGVDPAYQGRGLARPLTVLGVRHLQDQGLHQVMLYVDSDNRALPTYVRLGFRERHVDALYVRVTSAQVPR